MGVSAPVSRSAKKETTANLRKVLLKAYYILFGWKTHEETEECVEAFVEKTFLFDENLLLAKVFLGKVDADVRMIALLTQAVTKRLTSVEGRLALSNGKLTDFDEVFDVRLLSDQRSWPKSAKHRLFALRDFFEASAKKQISGETPSVRTAEPINHPDVLEAPKKPSFKKSYPTTERRKPLAMSEMAAKSASKNLDESPSLPTERSPFERNRLSLKRVEKLKESYVNSAIAMSIAFEKDSAIFFIAKESGITIERLTNAFGGLIELTEQEVFTLPSWCNQSLRLCLMQV